MKILIIDDEVAIHDVICEYAQYYGYECVGVTSGRKGLELLERHEFDVVIVDIMMPDLDGFITTKKIKEIRSIPVLILSARHHESDKLYGFEMGGDDYMTKPFSVKELMARLNVLTSRSNKQTRYVYPGVVVDLQGRYVEVNQSRVNLSLKEYELFVFLIQHENQVCSRELLLEKVWGRLFEGDERTVDTHIKSLRQHLQNHRDYILTVRGVGYKFEVI